MPSPRTAALCGMLLAVIPVAAAPWTVDLTTKTPPVVSSPLDAGTTRDPHGHEITADSQSFYLDGKPWIPVCGEFQFSRYPRAEWRDELLKMKAGGLDVVGTYLFWNHIEEERGKFDWSGNHDLRAFLQLAADVGLKAFVRIGPWAHGEARNGGFPDWVKNSGARLRTTDPAYMALVAPYYRQIAARMKGLLWKDGGPVIGIQVDNECGNTGYLLALKAMAKTDGIDVPFYAMTGWAVPIPAAGLLPMFGGYVCPFWDPSPRGGCTKLFVYTHIRTDCDMGAQLQVTEPEHDKSLRAFPFVDVEEGPGMQSSYKGRNKQDADDIAAMCLVRTGCGVNLRGYYVYHGGIQPDGKFSTMNEASPQPMPVKDYDFQAPLGACGQVRPQFGLLREQHLFLTGFGPALARMPMYLPDVLPTALSDETTLRWCVRTDGTSGFLFFNNHLPGGTSPAAHDGVQFALKSATGTQLVPDRPFTIPSGSFGVLPVGIDCDGVTLRYATAQPLCRVADGGRVVYFFAALDGIAPDLAFDSATGVTAVSCELAGTVARNIPAGAGAAVKVARPGGGEVDFVVLTPAQAVGLSHAMFAGKDRAILSEAVALSDGDSLRLQSDDPQKLRVAMFPPLDSIKLDGETVKAEPDGVFSAFTAAPMQKAVEQYAIAMLAHPAGPAATTLTGTSESAWDAAAVYNLSFPSTASADRIILDIHYTGDAARLYAGGKLVMDNYYNGDPMPIALWRISKKDWSKLQVKILPYSDALMARLPASAKKIVAAAKLAGTLDAVTVTAHTQFETTAKPL